MSDASGLPASEYHFVDDIGSVRVGVRWLSEDARVAYERHVKIANDYMKHLAETAQSLPDRDRIRIHEEGLRTISGVRESAADLYGRYTITDVVIMSPGLTKSP
jgi:hypothetical protein